MTRIRMPHNWTPRDYQIPMWQHFEQGGKRAFLLWHRRAGKDDNSLHFMASRAIEKAATYWYMLPEYSQARKAIWDAVNPRTGTKRIDEAFPAEIIKAKRNHDMTLELINGSMVNIVGSDNYNSLVGTPPYGLVFSEFSLTAPLSWAYLQPVLEENGGWAIFNCTPRGRNHAARLYETKQGSPGWFVQRCLPSETGIFGEQQLAEIRQDYMDMWGEDDGDALFRQEYLCSFDAALVGAYYAKLMEQADQAGRIGVVPHDPLLQVYTGWDLGMDDSTAIWFAQIVNQEIRLVDYIEASGQGLEYYVQAMRAKPYTYAGHYLPHDVAVRELGTGRSRLEMLGSLGLQNITVLPAQNPADRINACRAILPRCWFDAKACDKGLESLRNYRREYDEDRKVYKPTPYHDWTSHACDAFGQLAFGLKTDIKPRQKPFQYRTRRLI